MVPVWHFSTLAFSSSLDRPSIIRQWVWIIHGCPPFYKMLKNTSTYMFNAWRFLLFFVSPLKPHTCTHALTIIKPIMQCSSEWTIFRPLVPGKIQGDGRKFLDRFKSYFGSQISSQSLNEIHICWLQLKSATKRCFFFIYFCLWLSVRVGACCPLTFDLVSQ